MFYSLGRMVMGPLYAHWAACAQSCPTLCDSIDCSLSDSCVHGTFQGGILQWGAIFFSKDLPNPRTELKSLTLRADSSPSEPLEKPHISAYLSGFDISVYLISDISKPDKKL